MPSTISGLWVGDRLSRVERASISSFLSHGHIFELFTYGEVSGVPTGTSLRDAEAILPRRLLAPFVARGTLALFADWFRWKLLYERGGIWVDLDVICLREFRFDNPVVFGFQSLGVPCPAVLKFPAGHPACAELEDRCRAPNKIRPGDSFRRRVKKSLRRLAGNDPARIGWGEAGGPAGFQEVMAQFDLEPAGLPFFAFFPVHFTNWKTLFDDAFEDSELTLFSSSYAVHLWNEMHKTAKGWDKNADFHPASPFERLVAHFDSGRGRK